MRIDWDGEGRLGCEFLILSCGLRNMRSRLISIERVLKVGYEMGKSVPRSDTVKPKKRMCLLE